MLSSVLGAAEDLQCQSNFEKIRFYGKRQDVKFNKGKCPFAKSGAHCFIVSF